MGTPLNAFLLLPAFLTACVEVPLFWLCGYRKGSECAWFFLVNCVTNLLLNEFLLGQERPESYLELVLLSECAVVAIEYTLCRYFVSGPPGRLWLTVFFTNGCSFLLGCYLSW